MSNANCHTKRLIDAARHWAAFQEPDSVRDQATDWRLEVEAKEARTALLAAIEALSDEEKAV